MAVRTKRYRDRVSITLSGDLTHRRGGVVASRLLAAVQAHQPVEVVFGAITRADLAVAQILLSASELARERGQELVIPYEALPPALDVLFRKSGLHSRPAACREADPASQSDPRGGDSTRG